MTANPFWVSSFFVIQNSKLDFRGLNLRHASAPIFEKGSLSGFGATLLVAKGGENECLIT